MGGPRDNQTKRGKSDRKRQISYDITHLLYLKKMIQMILFTKLKHSLIEENYDYQGEG